jgi:hypothetical protein
MNLTPLDRMPPQIGDIISEAVYDAKLKSNPLHPITEKTTACYFIDVPGKERKMNDSFKVCLIFLLFLLSNQAFYPE